MKQIFKKLLSRCMVCVLLAGCGGQPATPNPGSSQSEKTFVYGTTGYGVEMGDEGLNPHSNYSGWSAVRYGVGETLFKFSDAMQPEPWLATDYEFLDDLHIKITLRDDVTFTSGRKMDGTAVKECLDHLLSVHDRAPGDLKIASVEAEGQTIIITTSEPTPALIHYLCDPYGAIIDMEYGIQEDSNVAGTGPYKATAVSDTEISLVKNEAYWGGMPKVDHIIVKSITDGDTLTMGLQSGEIDATYGLPYASYALFRDNGDYHISSCATSRTFFGQMNYDSAIIQEKAVRQAICMGLDKEGFVSALLENNGVPAVCVYPGSFPFGMEPTAPGYDPQGAKEILASAGWTDTDGDGYADKNGQKLTIRWLTYPGRQELPLLAESAQAALKEIGIDVEVNCTANHLDILNSGAYDVYVSALVTAPTGDPEYFFTTCCLDSSAKNRGNYHNDELEALAAQLHNTFDPEERGKLAVEMQQVILDDYAYFFVSHLQMSIVSKANISGMTAHPCDYYEITVDLDVG
ncbi:ABC transporter substrate-binding protein [bacterium 1XD42-1]|nr:ABC transporter substrate-binding protein [bacterium 1XD42-8]RKJ63248.1 ABC transporter substrate-binding protein [bacterium 1XD42-1]